MRRTAYLRWLAPVLAAFLVSGCGVLTHTKLKPKAKTLSHTELVQRANRACLRADRGFKASKFKPTRNFFRLDTEVRTILIPAYERLLFDLRALTPPPADAVAYRKLLATFNYFDLSLHQLLDVADVVVANRDLGLLKRVRNIEKRLTRLDKRFSSRAKTLELHRCA